MRTEPVYGDARSKVSTWTSLHEMKAKGKRQSGKSTDFPKRKNKLGKGKRPPENATKISFKSGSIVLPSQLVQSSSQQPTGKRKLGLEALLRHLNHFKPAVRSDGLTGLRELFQDHPHLLVPNLAKLVGPVLGKLIDSDLSVRHSLHTLLSTLFPRVTPHLIRPHFSSIVAHLCCGLTHISDKTQLDSLKVFRLLLDQYPSLLPPHAHHLLPLIVGLISRQRGGSVSSSLGKGVGGRKQASLTHDPRSKLSKWSSRVDVFNLLSRFLETLLECVPSSGSPDHGGSPAVVDLESRRVVVQRDGEFVEVVSSFCDFSGPVPCVMPLQLQGLPYKSTESLSTSDGDAVSPSAIATPSAVCSFGSQLAFSDVSKFLEFSESLLSLLLECWVECAPSQQSQSMKDTVVLMETIVHLLRLTLKLSIRVGLPDSAVNMPTETPTEQTKGAISVLREKFSADFSKHLLSNFPLPRQSPTNYQFVQYLKMNLSLCEIATLLLLRPANPSCPTLQSVCTYYGSLARVATIHKSISSQLMLECSRIIADTLPELLAVVQEHGLPESCLDPVLDGIGGFYHSCHSQSSAKRCLIHCFHVLLNTYNDSSRVFTQLLLPWLESLPQLLVDLGQSTPPLSAFIIDTLASAAPNMCLTQLEQHLLTLLGPEGVLLRLSLLSQRRFTELLWRVPTLSPRLLGAVGEWVWSTSGRVHPSVASYLVEVVHHRFLRKWDDDVSEADRVSQYIIFMLSVVLGDWQKGGEGKESQSQGGCVISLVEGERDMMCRVKIIDVVCECVRSTYFCDQVLELIAPTLQSLLESVHCLPVDTALSILRFLQCTSSRTSGIPSGLMPSLARLCYSVLRWAWQLGGVATARCCQVTKHLMRSFPALLVCVLELFASEIERGGGVREVAECFLSMLDTAELNLVLREHPATVYKTAATISGGLTDTEQDLRVRIGFSVKKFPSRP